MTHGLGAFTGFPGKIPAHMMGHIRFCGGRSRSAQQSARLGKRLYAPSLIPNFVKSIEKIQFYRRNSEVYGSERPVQPKIFKSTEPSGRKTTPSVSSSRR